MRLSFGVFIISGLFVRCASFSQTGGLVQSALPVNPVLNEIIDGVTVTMAEASLSIVYPESTPFLLGSSGFQQSKSDLVILNEKVLFNESFYLGKKLERLISVLKDRGIQQIALDPAIIEVIQSATFRSLLKSLELHDSAIKIITSHSSPDLVCSSDVIGLQSILDSNPHRVSGELRNGSDFIEITAEYAFGAEVPGESRNRGTPKEIYIGLSFNRNGKNINVVWIWQGVRIKRIKQMNDIEAYNRAQSFFKSDLNKAVNIN